MRTKLFLLYLIFFTQLLSSQIAFSQNIVLNPSFEFDSDNNGFPDNWGKRDWTTWETDQNYVRTGNKSLRLNTVTDPNWNYCRHMWLPKLKENSKYILKGYVKTENLDDGSWIKMRHASSPYPPSGYPTTNSITDKNTDWKELRVSFTTVDNNGANIDGPLDIMAYIPSGNAWIDDISLIEVIPYKIKLELSSSTVMADGNSFITVTAKIFDAYNNFLDAPGVENEISFSLNDDTGGKLIGLNPRRVVNGATTITYISGLETGTAKIRAEASGLISDEVEIQLIDYGWNGVPQLSGNYMSDIEDWWNEHPFNEKSNNYNPNILSQNDAGKTYSIYDVTADFGGDLGAAINSINTENAIIKLTAGITYTIPQNGILIAEKNNIHFISDGGKAIIKAPENFIGIPRVPENLGEANKEMIAIRSKHGDWHNDNYANNSALDERPRNFYFKNIIFDGNNLATVSVSILAVKDVVFDNCEFYGTIGNQEIHSGAWGDNIWIRGCVFKGASMHGVLLDGTHFSGILNSVFNYDYIVSSVQFFSNDDCSRDVNNNRIWDNEEIRLGNYIVVYNNEFGLIGSKNNIAVGAAVSNFLFKHNKIYGNGDCAVNLVSRCSQMVHGPLMPSYTYHFINSRIIGNIVTGRTNQFVKINSFNDQNTQDAPRSRCSGYERPYETLDGQACDSEIGLYQIRGNRVRGYDDQYEFAYNYDIDNNPVIETNLICGNCNYDNTDCVPSEYSDCKEPMPDYSSFGCYSNSGAIIYYLDGTNGDDSNDGKSISSAWKTFSHAINNISSASTLIIKEGIYELTDEVHIIGNNNTDGVSEYDATIIKAATGEKVIITGIKVGDYNKAPNIRVKGDFIRIEGIWFGGKWGYGNEFSVSGGGRVDNGREFIGCVFFGFNSIRGGLIENTFWYKNRFVRNGVGNDPPVFYMSGDHGIGYGQHCIIDDNLFITGKGYAINGWHSYHNFIITRNFIGNIWGGWIGDGRGSEYQGNAEGSDHLIANNLFWDSGEGQGEGFNAATMIASNTQLLNNIFINRSNIAVSQNENYGWQTLENSSINHNAFYNVPISYTGNDKLTINDLNEIGIIETEINSLINNIDSYFDQSIQDIFTNPEIINNFTFLDDLKLPDDSPFLSNGYRWITENHEIGIGTDIEIDDNCPRNFWNIFENLGLRQWDRDGKINLTKPSGYISDGSGYTNYRGYHSTNDPFNFKCSIAPENATFIDLHFDEFDTELNDDKLNVFKIENNNQILVNEYSGSTIPSDIRINSDKVLLNFTTDNDNTTGQGWKIQYTSDGIISGVADELSRENPSDYVLYQNYPNPFNPITKIKFSIPEEGKVEISVYDILGREVHHILNKNLTRGVYETEYHAENIPSGIYVCRIKVNSFTKSIKMLYLK